MGRAHRDGRAGCSNGASDVVRGDLEMGAEQPNFVEQNDVPGLKMLCGPKHVRYTCVIFIKQPGFLEENDVTSR